jgi:DNA-binding NarL/FixJ family response regulator
LYKEIADKLALTYATVHTHIRHIYEKLHVRSRTEAVARHLAREVRLPG